jgi:hypothetical protein
VLVKALELLERSTGPVLEDYPEEAGEVEVEAAPLACPVNFASPPSQATDLETLLVDFLAEIATMQTWFDIARTARNRSTSGVSGLDNEQIGTLFADFLAGEIVDREVHGHKLADILRIAAEDLRAAYLEAVSAQPGQSTNPNTLADWFWGETFAARVINEIRKRCLDMPTKDMRLAGELLLIPRNQLHRFEE